jgi:hypothetical protein
MKVHHHSHTHFQEQLLKVLVAQNNALWAVVEELKKQRTVPSHEAWSNVDSGVMRNGS